MSLPPTDEHDLFYDDAVEANATLWPSSTRRQLLSRGIGDIFRHRALADEEEAAEGAVNEGFGSPLETLTSIYRLMLGDFERDWFDRPLTLLMFFAYTFIANIMMLNVLVASLHTARTPPSTPPVLFPSHRPYSSLHTARTPPSTPPLATCPHLT